MTIQYLTPTPRSKMTKNRRTGIFLDRKGICWRWPMKSRPMPGTKASGLRKRMDGTVERR